MSFGLNPNHSSQHFLAKLFGCFMLRYPVYFGPNILFCWCINNLCLKTWNPFLAFWPDMGQCNIKDVILEQTVLQFVYSYVVHLLYIINENYLSPHNSDTDEWWLSINSFLFGCYSHWCHTLKLFYQYGQNFSLYLTIFLLF